MRLFLYGTLLAGNRNPVTERLHSKLAAGIPAVAHGRLYAIRDPAGWYPALLADPAGGKVHGMLHETLPLFGPADLAALDAYEGVEYARREIAVEAAGGTVAALAYVWTAELPNEALPVPHGSFEAFLALGHRAFGP